MYGLIDELQSQRRWRRVYFTTTLVFGAIALTFGIYIFRGCM